MTKKLSIVLIALAIGLSTSSYAQTKPDQNSPASSVPFVGCRWQTMTDPAPLPAPKGPDKLVQVDEKMARRLAYYAVGSSGILAPRGWHCFQYHGSNGFIMFVVPQPIDSLLSNVTGPAIQISYSDEGTSGRFEAAAIIARVFPTRMSFVQQVINRGISPASDFPSGPYPADKMTYRNDLTVEYQTPPNTEGLGTRSRLVKNSDPISGVIIDHPEEDGYLLHTAIRLPPDMNDLTSPIIQQFERDNAVSQSKN